MKKLIAFVFLISFCACLTHDEFCADPSQLTIFGYQLVGGTTDASRMFSVKEIDKMCKPLPPFVTPNDPIKTLMSMAGYAFLDVLDVFIGETTERKRVNGPELLATWTMWAVFDFIDIGRSLVLFSWSRPLSALAVVVLMPIYVVTAMATVLCFCYLCCFYVARFWRPTVEECVVERIRLNGIMTAVPMWNMAIATIEMVCLIGLFGSACAGTLWAINYVTQ